MILNNFNDTEEWFRALEASSSSPKREFRLFQYTGWNVIAINLSHIDMHIRIHDVGSKCLIYFERKNAELFFAKLSPHGVLYTKDGIVVGECCDGFQTDTEWVSMLIDNIEPLESYGHNDIFEVLQLTDSQYKQKFRGKVAGNKFGF